MCFQESGNIGTLSLAPHTPHICVRSYRTLLPLRAGAEIFTTFSSVPVVAKAIVTAVEALINPSTGRKYGEAAEGATEVPDIQDDVSATAAAATCASCFTCKVPEVRALWLLLAMTWGCVKDEEKFSGRVEDVCLDGGSWYELSCGPRDGIGIFMPTSQWATVYTKHRDFDSGRVQKFAGQFEQLAQDLGSDGWPAQYIADAWFKRDVGLGSPQGTDQAAPFYRAVCKQMRTVHDIDAGPGHNNFSQGSMEYITGHFLYEQYATPRSNSTPHSSTHISLSLCRRCKFGTGFELCSNPASCSHH